jgi:hypothetical protein
MKKQPDQSDLCWILIVASTLIIFFLFVKILSFVMPEPKPVYFLPAGAPDSIPCSSEINSNCMEYVRKDL